jgi:pimeloyl-ACP methyl ester carboxylesterase
MAQTSRMLQSGRFTDLPGVRLFCVDTGDATGVARSGEAVVFLHAFTGTHESFAPQLAVFAAAGHRAIAFDRRGFGNSFADPATGDQPGHACDDLEALIRGLELRRIHLVGVAAGAQVALDYAAWYGPRVASLVLAASLGPGVTEPELAAFSARIAIPGLDALPPQYREVGASYRGAEPEGLRRWLEIAARARQPGVAPQPLRSPNTYAKLAAIDAPTLVVAAGADLLSPPAMMRLWAKHLRNAEWRLVPDAGHAVNTERPELFNEHVLAFIGQARQPTQASS